MKKIKKGFILPSAAFTIKPKEIKFYKKIDKLPEAGDVAYGMISRIGEHSFLENASGRIHKIFDGTQTIFVFGNRYAPDYFEEATKALKEMIKQVGSTLVLKKRVAKKGLLIRHLILPGHLKNSIDVLKHIANTFSNKIYLSV